MLCFPLFDRENSSAKASELGKFLLDGLQPLMPLTVSDLSLWFISTSKPKSVVQLLNLSDLGAETPNLFAKHFEVIHTVRIAHPDRWRTGASPVRRENWTITESRKEILAAVLGEGSVFSLQHKTPFGTICVKCTAAPAERHVLKMRHSPKLWLGAACVFRGK